jgi:hypothetical protein
MLYTFALRYDAFGVTEPIDDTRNLKFPMAPHSERRAFIGAGYWFFWMNPATLSKLPVSWVEQRAKYASRTGAVESVTLVTYC